MRDTLIFWLTSILLSIVLTWYITIINIQPEKVIITQEKVIYRLKSDLELERKKDQLKYIIKIPFTDIGITQDHVSGFCVGAITVLAL